VRALLLVVVVGASCTADRTNEFVGSWNVPAGASSSATGCTGGIPPSMTYPLMSQQAAITRSGSTIVLGALGWVGENCAVSFHVTGSTATAESGQTCTVQITTPASMFTDVLGYATFTMTLDEPGTSLAIAATGNDSWQNTGAGTAGTCNDALTVTLAK
jgi:hypothetical protein